MPTTRQSHPIDDAKAIRGQSNTGPLLIHANEGKTYNSLNQATVPKVPFNIKVWRNGTEEIHGFTAAPVMDLGSVLLMMNGGEDAAGQALLRIMMVNLADDDRVPSSWQAPPIDRPSNAGSNWQPKFRAPAAPAGDGKLHTLDEAHRWTDPDKGSSRRRWSHLMFEDDGVIVTAEVVIEIIKDLMGSAAGLPTDGS